MIKVNQKLKHQKLNQLTKGLQGISRVLIVSILLFLTAFPSSANDMANAFQLMSAEEYAQAEEIYKSILKSGSYSVDLYHNLSIANFHQDDIAEAILYAEKALKHNPGYTKAKQNLKVYKSEIVDPVYEIQPFFLIQAWRTFISLLPIYLWTFLSLSGLVGLLYGVKTWLLSVDIQSKKRGFVISTTTLVICLISLMALFGRYTYLNNDTDAIVQQDSALHSGPSEQSAVTETMIPAGTKVVILDSLSGWQKVRLPDREVTWMKSEWFELI